MFTSFLRVVLLKTVYELNLKMDLRSASLVLLVTLMVLSHSMAEDYEDDIDEAVLEAGFKSFLGKIYRRDCEHVHTCDTVNGETTCTDKNCCHRKVFGRKLRQKPACTVITKG